MIYTHVEQAVRKSVSPLDRLDVRRALEAQILWMPALGRVSKYLFE